MGVVLHADLDQCRQAVDGFSEIRFAGLDKYAREGIPVYHRMASLSAAM